MQLEVGGMYAQPYRPPLYNLRWSAILAGLVVAVAANIFLMLLGGAGGLAVVNAGLRTSESALLTAVSVWNTFCMIAASVAGGYVAARASGMRRTPDGVLHGVLAWGVAMLVYLTLAASAGVALSEAFSAAEGPVAAEAPAMTLEERLALADSLERRLGLTPEQANSVIDQMLALSGQQDELAREPRVDPRQVLRAASTVSGWLSTAILLSLLGAVGGGVLGSRSARRKPPLETRELDVAE